MENVKGFDVVRLAGYRVTCDACGESTVWTRPRSSAVDAESDVVVWASMHRAECHPGGAVETCEDRGYRCCDLDETPADERDRPDWYDRHVAAYRAAEAARS